MATVAEKQADTSAADTADEAAIVQHMRESGTLPQWVQEEVPPPADPPPLKARLSLPCGAVIWAERSPGGYFYHGVHLLKIDYPRGFDFGDALRRLPAQTLAALEATVADLRQIVGTIT
jgi:hypothetical protein